MVLIEYWKTCQLLKAHFLSLAQMEIQHHWQFHCHSNTHMQPLGLDSIQFHQEYLYGREVYLTGKIKKQRKFYKEKLT